MVWANYPRISIEQCHHLSVTPRRLERRKHHAVWRRGAMWYPVHWRGLSIPLARDHRVGLGFLRQARTSCAVSDELDISFRVII